jgi:hypothetical protein
MPYSVTSNYLLLSGDLRGNNYTVQSCVKIEMNILSLCGHIQYVSIVMGDKAAYLIRRQSCLLDAGETILFLAEATGFPLPNMHSLSGIHPVPPRDLSPGVK